MLTGMYNLQQSVYFLVNSDTVVVPFFVDKQSRQIFVNSYKLSAMFLHFQSTRINRKDSKNNVNIRDEVPPNNKL